MILSNNVKVILPDDAKAIESGTEAKPGSLLFWHDSMAMRLGFRAEGEDENGENQQYVIALDQSQRVGRDGFPNPLSIDEGAESSGC